MVTSEELAKWKADAESGFRISVDRFIALIAEVERLKKDQDDWRKGVDYIRGPLVKFAGKELPTLCCITIQNAVLEVCAENERLRQTVKQWEATAAAQSSAIERLRHRQPSDLDERDRTFSHVMPAMDAARKTHDPTARVEE